MNNTMTDIAALTPQQRTILELRLKEKRAASAVSPSVIERPGRKDVCAVEDNDDENAALAKSNSATDELLGDFYGTFPFPWQPTTFSCIDDPRCEAVMVNQDIGDWEHRRLKGNPAIWVAGCGTNQ